MSANALKAEEVLRAVLETREQALPGKFPRALRARKFTNGSQKLGSNVEFRWENITGPTRQDADMVVKVGLNSGANVLNFELARVDEGSDRCVSRVYWTRLDPDGVSLLRETQELIEFLKERFEITVTKDY